MTDADDLPIDAWRAHFEIALQPINRSKYSEAALPPECAGKLAARRGRVERCTFPEMRVPSGQLGEAPVAEFLEDLRAASRCRALVGTFSSSATKLTFLLMVAAHATVPPFISLGGCVAHAMETGIQERNRHCQGASRFLNASTDML